ncbi:hypothetical protein PVAP13_8NG048703 [Panicum virgatum]|uniref:Uncharacterized protein n=1 Tax=Panicum virgatum TaxID=38727 RepID=A0A8T0P4J2_PANVG|nr:hypothetical protein PVAP13_8NG048703 [Panicum virgatum]
MLKPGSFQKPECNEEPLRHRPICLKRWHHAMLKLCRGYVASSTSSRSPRNNTYFRNF